MMTVKTMTKVTTLTILRCDESDGNEKRQKSTRFNEQNNNFARASRFFVHFFAVTARLQRENAQLHILWWTYTRDDEIFLLFMNLHMVLRNSTPAEFAYIWQSRYIDIIPIKILKLEFTFKRRFYCRPHPLILSAQMIMISHENSKESTAV